MKTTDVIVVGGGVIGASIAFHLAERGVGVTLVEKDSLAAGPTGRSCGIIRQHYSHPVTVRMALESIYRALDTATPDALAFESSLFGLLASTEDMKEGMAAFMEKRKADFKGD